MTNKTKGSKASKPQPKKLPTKVKTPTPAQAVTPFIPREDVYLFDKSMPNGPDAETAKTDAHLRDVVGFLHQEYDGILRIAAKGLEDVFKLDDALQMIEDCEFYAEKTTRTICKIMDDFHAHTADVTPSPAAIWEMYVAARSLSALLRAIGENPAMYAPTRSAIFNAAVQSLPDVSGVHMEFTHGKPQDGR